MKLTLLLMLVLHAAFDCCVSIAACYYYCDNDPESGEPEEGKPPITSKQLDQEVTIATKKIVQIVIELLHVNGSNEKMKTRKQSLYNIK